MRRRGSGKVALLVLGVVVVGLLGAAGGFAAGRALRPARTAAPRAAVAEPAAYRAAGRAVAPPRRLAPVRPPSPAAVRRALGSSVTAAGLGARLRARVIDLASGAVLYDHGGSVPAAPASTAKLLTTAALLSVRSPTDRLVTTVRSGPHGAIVLVGGGDPTLSGAPAGTATPYPGAARLSSLAAALRHAHVRPTRILVDDALFAGPTTSPGWDADDVPSGYASAITAVLADGGRASPRAAQRSAAPDLAAAHELAAVLGHRTLPVGRTTTATGAVLATVRSAPLSILIEQMLQRSDNTLAEALARQVAIAEHLPPSFTGAARAIRTVLARAGVRVGGGMLDASGLSSRDRLTPAALAAVVRLAAGTPRLRTVIAALPVAAWSGTLAGRFHGTPAAGLVRLKTGTLTGVSSLAGIVRLRGGADVAIAMIADRTAYTPAAEQVLDAVIDRLAACACR